jgi:hypothetical protein
MGQTVYPSLNYPQYPTWTTNTRPSTSGLANGYVGFNSSSSKLEIWNGAAWKDMLGGTPAALMPWAGTAITFTGASSNVSGADVASVGKGMANSTASTSAVQTGGTMTINSVSLGSYDFVIKNTSTTVSTFTNSDWFTTTADTRSAWVVVQGDLTIPAGVTFIPSNRKLFTCIYVTGNLNIGGTISMASRGSNHSGTGVSGGSVTAGAIRIATGTYTSISNPEVPAAGGAAVASSTNGTAGTGGGTGSGGGGQNDNAVAAPHGAAGTSFSGGAGGGGGRSYGGIGTPNAGAAGGANGGAGGAALPAGGPYPTANPSSGGSGNNGGAGGENAGNNGTGGVLFIIVEGTISGAGSITVNGAAGTAASERPGGGSGGGSVTVLSTTDSSTITPTAAGGAGVSIYGSTTNGGAGTARKLAIA